MFHSCPPPLVRGVRGDSSCLLPLPCSLLPAPYSLLPKNMYLTQLKTAVYEFKPKTTICNFYSTPSTVICYPQWSAFVWFPFTGF
ncbi:MAG: hypothetical protein F6K56_34785 [Moorea sp. SIO3G5]|nr:hypothetical protein [Moorena sp. SIO3G5]